MDEQMENETETLPTLRFTVILRQGLIVYVLQTGLGLYYSIPTVCEQSCQ